MLITSPSLKSTHCPQIAPSRPVSFSPPRLCSKGIWDPQGPEGEEQPLCSTLSAYSGHKQSFAFLFRPLLHPNHPVFWFAPKGSKHCFYFPLACLCFCHAPHLESPPCPLISADPTSIAEGRIQTLPFQRSPPPPSSYTSCLYQLLGIVEVLLCKCVCVCLFYLLLRIHYLLPQ